MVIKILPRIVCIILIISANILVHFVFKSKLTEVHTMMLSMGSFWLGVLSTFVSFKKRS
jgi:hypothetical protein